MLDDGIVELGPAVNAGLLGLAREFPNLNGPEEAQEFYFHVYNILGDPSISIYLNEPHEFSISIEELSVLDGYLEISVSDENGFAVADANISVITNDRILFKGNTDSVGQSKATIDVSDIPNVDVFVNKASFIQGHSQVLVSSYDYDLALLGYEINDANENGNLEVGELADIYPVIKNIGNSTSNYTGTVDIDNLENYQIISSEFEIPELGPGDTASISTPITVRVNSKDSDHIKLNIVDQTGEWSFNFAIPVIKPQWNVL